jgi:hypothetical protein
MPPKIRELIADLERYQEQQDRDAIAEVNDEGK